MKCLECEGIINVNYSFYDGKGCLCVDCFLDRMNYLLSKNLLLDKLCFDNEGLGLKESK